MGAVQKIVDEALELVSIAEATAGKADTDVRTLKKDLSPDELRSAAEGVQGSVAKAKEEHETAVTKFTEVEQECAKHQEVTGVSGIAKRAVPSLKERLSALEAQIAKSHGTAQEAIERAAQKAYAELERKRTEVIEAIRALMKKNDESAEKIFEKASSGEESLSVEKFAAFLGEIEGLTLAESDSERVAKHMIADGEAEVLAKETFMGFFRLFYKCIKVTTMSEELAIKSKSVRKLELNEVL